MCECGCPAFVDVGREHFEFVDLCGFDGESDAQALLFSVDK
jgi:hypothetical protein